MNTCGKCHFYEGGLTITTTTDGVKTTSPGGWCWGAPPSANGSESSRPTVKEDQRECALWREQSPPKAATAATTKRKVR